jgi:hypothetical protein
MPTGGIKNSMAGDLIWKQLTAEVQQCTRPRGPLLVPVSHSVIRGGSHASALARGTDRCHPDSADSERADNSFDGIQSVVVEVQVPTIEMVAGRLPTDQVLPGPRDGRILSDTAATGRGRRSRGRGSPPLGVEGMANRCQGQTSGTSHYAP